MILQQGSLFEQARTRESWPDFLARELRRPVEVRIGRARSSVLRYRRDRTGATVLHMNAFFLQAPAEIRAAVAAWMRSGRRARAATRALNDWIRHEVGKLPAPAPRRAHLQTRGRVHDLEALATPLWGLFPVLHARRPGLTWGRAGSRQLRRRSLRLGSYSERSHLVRVHPTLDRESVPEWFVRYILFHELLHAELGIQRNGARRVIHGPEFRRREREYPDYARAIAWEREKMRSALAAKIRVAIIR